MQHPSAAYFSSLGASISKYTDAKTKDLIICLLSEAQKFKTTSFKGIGKETYLKVYTDSALHRSAKSSQHGYLIAIDDTENNLPDSNFIAWSSRRDPRLCHSTSSAELLPILEALIQLQFVIPIVRKTIGLTKTILFTDARITMHQIMNPFNASENKFDLLFARQLLDDLKVELRHIDTSVNPADSLTKLTRTNKKE